ncbi:MAG: AAA family ATPase [bacterium]
MNGGYFDTRKRLRERVLTEDSTRIQMLTGPRQVGKTTILLELARDFGTQAIYRAADVEEIAIPGWWSIQWGLVLRMAQKGKTLFIIDEVHTMPNWARLLKVAYDEIYREKLPIQIVISGSAALPITAGARNELAGRFELLTLRHWTVGDISSAFKMTPDEAAEVYVRFGAFPGELNRRDDYARWRDYILHSILDPALNRDLLLLERVNKPALLRQISSIASAHPSEIISLQKLAAMLLEKGTLETISHYLALLNETYLLAAIDKYSEKELRRRAAPPKLVPLSNAFLTAYSEKEPPTAEKDPIQWGHWLENACIAATVNAGFQVSYWREEPYEIDMAVIENGNRWAIEIKSGKFTMHDLQGLLTFVTRYKYFRPLIIGEENCRNIAESNGIDFIRWQDYLFKAFPE